jgi:hypothetical protein
MERFFFEKFAIERFDQFKYVNDFNWIEFSYFSFAFVCVYVCVCVYCSFF